MGIIHPTDAASGCCRAFAQIGVVFILFQRAKTHPGSLAERRRRFIIIAMGVLVPGSGNGGFAVYGLAGESGGPWHA